MEGDPDASDLLVRAGHALRRRWMAALEPWNVSPHEFRALRAVSEMAPARLSDLADRLRIANRSVTEVVDALEGKGLVRRTPSPTDRRAVVVELTARGHELAAELDHARRTAGTEFLEPLSDADRETLRGLLTRLLAEADPPHPDARPHPTPDARPHPAPDAATARPPHPHRIGGNPQPPGGHAIPPPSSG